MKKQPAMIAICAALLVCVAAAGCTSSTSSPNASATANSSSQAATASVTPTPTPTPTPPPTHLTVLFFYEPDCPYCQALEGTSSFHQLENKNKVTVTPIQSYTSTLTDQYNVTTIPTLILLNNGHELARWVAPADASAINARIASLFKAG